jgi:hypothetical protein
LGLKGEALEYSIESFVSLFGVVDGPTPPARRTPFLGSESRGSWLAFQVRSTVIRHIGQIDFFDSLEAEFSVSCRGDQFLTLFF